MKLGMRGLLRMFLVAVKKLMWRREKVTVLLIQLY